MWIQWSRDILTPFLLTVALYHRFCHGTKLLLYKIALYSIDFQKSGFEKSANSIGFEWPKCHFDYLKSCFYNISRVVSIFFFDTMFAIHNISYKRDRDSYISEYLCRCVCVCVWINVRMWMEGTCPPHTQSLTTPRLHRYTYTHHYTLSQTHHRWTKPSHDIDTHRHTHPYTHKHTHTNNCLHMVRLWTLFLAMLTRQHPVSVQEDKGRQLSYVWTLGLRRLIFAFKA